MDESWVNAVTLTSAEDDQIKIVITGRGNIGGDIVLVCDGHHLGLSVRWRESAIEEDTG